MKRKFMHLIFALVLVIIILCSQIIEQQQQFQQRKMIVYNVPKTSAIDFINAKNNVLLTDTAFAHNESGLLFRVKHNWWDLGINNNQIISGNLNTNNLKIKNNSIQFFDKRVIIIDSHEKYNKSNIPLPVDYLVISKTPRVRIAELLKHYNAKMIVFDSSNSEYSIKKWKSECIALNQAFYSVIDSGAFIADL